MTEVKYKEANLLEQEKALRKFVGRSVLSGVDVERVEDSTYLTPDNVQKVLFNKDWVKKKDKMKREVGDPPSAQVRKKNLIGKYGNVAKCFKCRCNHSRLATGKRCLDALVSFYRRGSRIYWRSGEMRGGGVQPK